MRPSANDARSRVSRSCSRCSAALPLHAEGDPFLRRTTTVRVVERTGPAVVNVTTEQRAPRAANPFRPFAGDPFFDRFFQDFFEPRVPQARAEPRLGRADRRAAPRAHQRARRHARGAASA